MRVVMALTSLLALALLPAAAEAGRSPVRHGAHVVRVHSPRHAEFARFNRLFRRNGNEAPFLGSGLYDGGFDGTVAEAPPESVGSVASLIPRLPRRVGDGRATVEVENGVTVVRGPGSHHLAP